MDSYGIHFVDEEKAFPFGKGGTASGTSEPMAVTDEVKIYRLSEM